MTEHKMGTQLARDLCQTFRGIAENTTFPEFKEKLVSLAGELEGICTKLYFKTQKGTEEMEKFVAEMAELQGKVANCKDAEAAQSMCAPFFDKIEKYMHHAKTMKVRMT